LVRQRGPRRGDVDLPTTGGNTVATLQLLNRSYRVLFSYGGKRCTYTLGRVGRREADNAAAAADQVLLRIEKRLLRVPDGADIVSFVKNGGRVEQEEKEAAPPPSRSACAS
jgi:hypothetical protein